MLHFRHIGMNGCEERLLGRTTGGDNRPFLERVTGNTARDLSQSIQGFTDPNAARERQLNDNRDRLQSFQDPDIFSALQNASLVGKGGNRERLLSMTPERRVEEFNLLIAEQIPETVRAKYGFLFAAPIDMNDVFEYEQKIENSRIGTILTALAIVNGTRIPPHQNQTADMLALDISAETNNSAASPGSVATLYTEFLDANPDISPTDAVSPEFIIKRLKADRSGRFDRLLGDLTNTIDPSVQASMLKEMFEMRRNRDINQNITFEQAKLDQLQLTQSVEKARLRQESRSVVDNFRNADPRLQLAMAAGGGLLLWQVFKAKNPIGRWALIAGTGYFAYDRFVNGNVNAFEDMAKAGQKFAKTSGNLLKNLAREAGVPFPRDKADRLEIVADFIQKNRLDIPGHEAMTAMSALANVKLGTIAPAFNLYTDGDQLGGNLVIDDGQGGAGANGQSRTVDASGNLLFQSLKQNLEGTAAEKNATIKYILNNNESVGRAVAHAFYMLAMDETENVARSEQIEKALAEYGSYDNLPTNLKKMYVDIALRGKILAETKFSGMSLVDVIANLNIKRKNKVERKDDPAVDVPDIKTAARTDEFALVSRTTELPTATAKASDVLADGGLSEADTIEFLRNCESSNVITGDAALALARSFDKIRRETPQLTEALQTIEKLKYAVLVQSTKQEEPLTARDVELLTGPDDLTATSILNRVTGFLGRFSISLPGRGFGSIASLKDVRSLITEPWFGTGPVQSKGDGFKKLTERMDIFDKRVAGLKDTNAVAKQMAGAMPDTMSALFGGRDKMEEAFRSFLPKTNYKSRIDRAEQHVSQRMANALARAMRLTHESDGFGRFDDLGVTPREQANLAQEFDVLFVEIMGDPLKSTLSMWQRSEDIDVYNRFSLTDVEAVDFADEPKRTEQLQFARDMAGLYLMQRSAGIGGLDVRPEFVSRTRVMYDKMIAEIKAQKQKELDAIQKEIDEAKTANPSFVPDFDAIKARLEKVDIVLSNTLAIPTAELRMILEKIYEQGFTDPTPNIDTLRADTDKFIDQLKPPPNPPGPQPGPNPPGPQPGPNPPGPQPGPNPPGPQPGPNPPGPQPGPNPPGVQPGPNPPGLNNNLPNQPGVNPPGPNPPGVQPGPNPPGLNSNQPNQPGVNLPPNAPLLPNTINTPAGIQQLQNAIDALGLRGFFDLRSNGAGGIDYTVQPFTNAPQPKDIATSSTADIESFGSDPQLIVKTLHQKLMEWQGNLSDQRRQEFVDNRNTIQMDPLRYTPDIPPGPNAPGAVPPNINSQPNIPPPPGNPGRVPTTI